MSGIVVNNLGKAYKRYPTRWARLVEWTLPWSESRHLLNWVLRDINFTVNPGEAVGIIGINGAGKSTLLKIIAGTVQPTTGNAQVTGRVAALLELGMGFHPDFTGRQNAIMAGQLLGYSVEEINALMPEIEAFAEIGDYIDQPVRVYSSGMQMRLAFSVATARRPDVLIVDEALSVGDAYFQHKSFDRIRQFNKKGTTLLLVSHDKNALQSICDRAILLNAGRLEREGAPESVIDYYNALLADGQHQMITQQVLATGKIRTVSGSGGAKVTSISLKDEQGKATDVFAVGRRVQLYIAIKSHEFIDQLVCGYKIKDRFGQVVFGTNTSRHDKAIRNVEIDEDVIFIFDFECNIGPGLYSVSVALHSDENHLSANYCWIDCAFFFEVVNFDKKIFHGFSWIEPEISIIRRVI